MQETIELKPIEGKILLVEKNPTNRLLTLKFIERVGCLGYAINDLKEIENISIDECYDLLLIGNDLLSEEAFEKIKEFNPVIPIVSINNDFLNQNKNFDKYGVSETVERPINLKKFHNTLNSILNPNIEESVEEDLSFLDQNALDNLKMAIGEEGIKELVKVYLETLDDNIETIVSQLENNEIQNASKSAHSLKSSSLSLGGVKLGELCKEIELLAGDESKYTPEMIQNLKDNASEFRGYLEGILAT
jgi:HPt (histidine-containing phosphotransfer) domain-containing protein